MRKEFLKEHQRGIFSGMMLVGTLKEHCLSIQHQAEERMDFLVKQMASMQGVNEQMKVADQMRWVRLMSSIVACADEIVICELITV